MKRYLPFLLLLCAITLGVGANLCFRELVNERDDLKAKLRGADSAALTLQDQLEELKNRPGANCGAAVVALEQQYQGALIMLRESYAREKSLEQIIAAMNAKPATPVKPRVGKQVVDLPADAGNWYATLFVADDYEKHANQVAAVKMWNTSDWCRDLQAKCHGRLMKIGAKEAKAYWPHVKATPALILQDPNGLVVYSEVNPDLSKRPRQLVNSINSTMKKRKHCPDKFCPFIPPDQADKEEEDGKPEDVVVKPSVDKPAEKKSSALPALALGGIAFAVIYAVKFAGVAHRA